ncbi:hypothetical protein [Pseudoxanthomonas sp. GM95]|uniref:hypothetical protein n=1 Tax=Pseudoxanthomonas sp. GM95 TaxID=1881043 RepID=UPI000B8569CA|nr:hypothetical protein [Pseudoxanthomonas sp. GM95]
MYSLDLTSAYETARTSAAPGELLVLMRINDESTELVHGTGLHPAVTLALQVGAVRVVREQFNGRFPGLLQLENAIATVEDEVTKPWLPPGQARELVLFDAGLHDNVAIERAHHDAPIAMALDEVERWFNRLVAVVAGSPPSQQGVPDDPEFAARLLIVREALHHLKISGLRLEGAVQAG